MPGNREGSTRAVFHCLMSYESWSGKGQTIISEMLTRNPETSRNLCPTELYWNRLKQSDMLPNLYSSACITCNWYRFLPSAISKSGNATKDTNSHHVMGAQHSMGH